MPSIKQRLLGFTICFGITSALLAACASASAVGTATAVPSPAPVEQTSASSTKASISMSPTEEIIQAPPAAEPSTIYIEQRDKALAVRPGDLGIAQSPDTPHVWGMLIDIGYPKSLLSMVTLANGTTSLFSGIGSGVLGAETRPGIAQAAKALVAESEKYLQKMHSTTTFPVPGAGRVKFYLLTFSGVFTLEAAEQDLSGGQQALSPLYAQAVALIRQLQAPVKP
jgi:hypothetical protein